MPIQQKVKKSAYARAGAIVLFSSLFIGTIWWMTHNKTNNYLASEIAPVKVKTEIGYLPITDHLVLGISMAKDAGSRPGRISRRKLR